MPYDDPIAQGIQNFVGNYMARRKLDEEIKLRKLQEAERAQKIAEAETQKEAAQNLSNIVAMRSGNWKDRAPTVVATSPDATIAPPPGYPKEISYDAPGLVNVPAGGSMEGEQVVEKPSQQYLTAAIANEEQSLAKKSPSLFFSQREEVRKGKYAEQRAKKMAAQTARIQSFIDLKTSEKTALGMAQANIKRLQAARDNAIMMENEELVDNLSLKIDEEMEKSQQYLVEKTPPLKKLFGKGKKSEKTGGRRPLESFKR